MKRIIVTGGLGFVGSHLVAHFHRVYPDAQIVILDKFCYSARFEYVQSLWGTARIELLSGDICDAGLCREALAGADLLIHAAAESHVDNSFRDSGRFIRTNVNGTYTLVEAAIAVDLPLMVHVSTDEVYGERPHEDVDETGSLAPSNPYSASKAAADLLVLARHRADKLPVIIVRANNMYGSHQFPEKIIPRFICHALMGKPLPVHGDGTNRRSFLSVEDFAEALETVVRCGRIGQIYNIGSKDEFSILQIAELVAAEFGRNVDDMCEFVPDRPFNDSRYGIIDDRIKGLGWRQRRRLMQNFPKLTAWYRGNIHLFERFLASGERVGRRVITAGHFPVVTHAAIHADLVEQRERLATESLWRADAAAVHSR